MKKVFYILAILFTTTALSQNNTLFSTGNKLYNDGKYNEAIVQYESILSTGKHSSELYFNLGNAHYKLNNIAPSIYYYEKALKLSPNDIDIKNNLAYAKNMTIDAIDVVPEVGFSRLIKNITNIMSFDYWAILSVVLVLVFVVLFISYYFSQATSKKRIAFIISSISLGFACLALIFAFNKHSLDKNDKPAIVFAKESQVKSEPNFRSEESFKLHEGTKVQILDTVNNWKKIKLSDGTIGWISSEDIKSLNKF